MTRCSPFRSVRNPLLSFAAVLIAGGSAAWAQAPATRPAMPSVSPGASGTSLDAASILKDPAVDPSATSQATGLGQPFDSLSGGISLRPPADAKSLREVGTDEIVQFVDKAFFEKMEEMRKNPASSLLKPPAVAPQGLPGQNSGQAQQYVGPRWSLSVRRRSFPAPQRMIGLRTKIGDPPREVFYQGLLEAVADEVKKEAHGDASGPKAAGVILRQDTTNLGNYTVGMVIARYNLNGERRFVQHAIIEANDQLYYFLAYSTPARKDEPKDESDVDAGELAAVQTFQAVLDSVKLLDRAAIKADQDLRLFRTRTLYQNWTEKKLSGIVVPKQWMRIIQEDAKQPGLWRDIGYSYIEESIDRKGAQDGITVGIRTRKYLEPGKQFPREDSESILFVTMDRSHEDWSRLLAFDPDGLPKGVKNPWPLAIEFGSSDLRTGRFLIDPEFIKKQGIGRDELHEMGDKKQPAMGVKDSYTLNVEYSLSRGEQRPVTRPLPPFYLPQAMGVLLPRLVPPNEPKNYMMAAYVSDTREVMLRYVDVGSEGNFTLAGRGIRAVPISDRYGMEGSPTVHYVTANGAYLGSENKSTRVVVVPTDEPTLKSLWLDANLTRPDVQRQPAAPR